MPSFCPAPWRANWSRSRLTTWASRLVEAMTATGNIAAGSADRVVNALVVRGRDQVMLKVTVAEVERDVIKAARRQPVRYAGLRHGRHQFQQHQSVLGARPVAQRLRDQRHLQVDHRHVAGHGTGPASFTRWPSRT